MELTNHRSSPRRAQSASGTSPTTTLPLSLTVVRHGQSTANAAFEAAEAVGALDVGISCRDADLSLTALGRNQAEALGRWIAARGGGPVPHSLWVSPYLRAQETAEAVLTALDDAGLPLPDVRTDERLRDRELGILEMLTSAAIELHHPAEAARRRLLGELRWRPPGGESCADVALRLRSLLRDVYEQEADRRVLLVAHDAVVFMLRHVIDNLDEAELMEQVHSRGVGNTALTRWSRTPEGRFQLDCYATTPHLE